MTPSVLTSALELSTAFGSGPRALAFLFDLELERPMALLALLPLVFLWWRVRPEPETWRFPSRRLLEGLSTPTESRRRGLLLLFSTLLTLIFAKPVQRPPDSNSVEWLRDLGPFGTVHEGYRDGTPFRVDLEVSENGALPFPGARARALARSSTFPVPLHDATGFTSLEPVWQALEATGWIERVEDPRSAEVVVHRGAEWETDRAAVQSVGARRVRFVFPSVRAPSLGILPALATRTASPILDGLPLDRWSLLELRDPAPEATTSLDGEDEREVLLASDLGPVIERRGGTVLFSFDPDREEVSARPEWPVVFGRLLEACFSEPPAFPVPPPPARWPRLAAGLAAIVLIPFLGFGSLAWPVALIVLAMAIFGDAVSTRGTPPTIEVATPESLLDAIEHASRGEELLVPTTLPPPSRPDELLDSLATRGLGLDLRPTRPVWIEAPARARVGQTIPLEVRATATLQTTEESDGSVDPGETGPRAITTTVAVPALVVTDPEGVRTRIERFTSGTERGLEFTPDAPGLWSFEFEDISAGTGCVVEVEDPGRALIVGDDGGMAPLFPAAEVLDAGLSPATLESRLAPAGSEDRTSSDAPTIVAWNRGTTPDGVAKTLDAWVRRGGTLFVTAGPPFLEPRSEEFDRLVGEALPSAPRRVDADYGVVLVDLSGSLARDRETIIAGVRALLDATPAGARWGVVGFRNTANWILRPGSPVTADFERRFTTLVDPGGGTRLDLPLDLALEYLESLEAARSPGDRVNVVLITDGRVGGAAGAGGVGAQWVEYGRRLGAAGAELGILGIGPGEDHAALRALADAANGRLTSVSSPTDAARVLARAVDEPPRAWRTIAGPIRAGARPDLFRGLPRDLPAPRRTRARLPDPPSDAIPLWVDAEGRARLTLRLVGRGRVLYFRSGLDAESLPGGGAATTLREALARTVQRAARDTARERRRRVSRGFAPDGSPVWLVERRPDDPLVRELERLEVDGVSSQTIEAIGDVFPVPDASALVSVRITGESWTRPPPGVEDRALRWRSIAAEPLRRAPTQPLEGLGLLAVALLWVVAIRRTK